MNLTEAKRIIGSMGFPLKMPGTSYGLPASRCIAGARLAKVSGTVCSQCYALAGRHAWINPAKAQQRRLEAISDPRWVDAMTKVLLHIHATQTFRIDCGVKNAKARGLIRFRQNTSGFHRWHDSGDLQSVEHLAAINEVARRTPAIKHWLPTQELGMLRRFLEHDRLAPNLVVRVSSPMIDDQRRRSWPLTSSVFAHTPPAHAHVCPAPQQEHRCGSCRACWSPAVPHVAYELH